MTEEINIKMKNADGHAISGAYKTGQGIITVRLSNGRSHREQRDYRLMAEEHAMRMLLKLDREARGKS
ncbi:MAG: hypothetical protein WBG10_12155 [Pseudolabrys sp.]